MPTAKPKSASTLAQAPAQPEPARPDGDAAAAAALDQKVQALMATATGAQSPALNGMAWWDWISHLLASPGKQWQLWQMAQQQAMQWGQYAVQSAGHTASQSAEHAAARLVGQGRSSNAAAADDAPAGAGVPAAPISDRRFADPAWQQWPFSAWQQAWLMQEKWWQAATHGIRGVKPHHADWTGFMAQQYLGMLSPSNFAPTNPVVLQRTVQENGANLLRGLQHLFEDTQRQMGHKPPAISEEFVVGRDLAITPGKVVLRTPLMELIQYAPTTAKVQPEPVLIVPAWIMKYYILDLSPHNSLIKYLVDQGHTVFAISWKNPGKPEHNLTMQDYLDQGLFAAMRAINAIAPKAGIHACGYCLGGTLLSIGAARLARDGDERLKTITLLAAQTDFSEPGELSLFIDESQLNLLDAQMAENGYLDASQMAGAFVGLRSYDLLWSKMVNEYLLGDRARSMDLLAWNADTTRMPARMHTDYLRQMFLHNDLARGKYLVDGRPVVLNDLTAPIYAVGTESDHVAPWKSVYKIHLLADSEITFVLTNSGHNAGIVSEPGHKRRHYRQLTRPYKGGYLSPDEWLQAAPSTEGSWWESWHAWLSAHSGAPKTPPALGAPAKGYKVLGDAPGTYVLER